MSDQSWTQKLVSGCPITKKDLVTFISFKHLCGKNHELGDGHDIVAKKINLLSNEVVKY